MCKILATENSISKEQLLVKGDVKRSKRIKLKETF